MAKVELKTIGVYKAGCVSSLLIDDRPICVTMEHTFENDRPLLAVGAYPCVRSRYYRGGYDTFEIKVAGHSRVLFHKGNTEDDSRGCVLLGQRIGFLGNQLAVLDSGAAFKEFMDALKDTETFILVVTGR